MSIEAGSGIPPNRPSGQLGGHGGPTYRPRFRWPKIRRLAATFGHSDAAINSGGRTCRNAQRSGVFRQFRRFGGIPGPAGQRRIDAPSLIRAKNDFQTRRSRTIDVGNGTPGFLGRIDRHQGSFCTSESEASERSPASVCQDERWVHIGELFRRKVGGGMVGPLILGTRQRAPCCRTFSPVIR